MQPRAWLFALLTVLCWSTAATAFKFSLRVLSPAQTLLVANIVSLAVFSIALVAGKKTHLLRQTTRKQLMLSAFQGLLNPFGYYLILFQAYHLLPAQIAQPVNFIWPVMLMLLAAVFLRQPIRLQGIAAMAVSFTGVLVLSRLGRGMEGETKLAAGVLLALVSSIVWALFWIANLKDKRDDFVKLFLSAAFSLPLIAGFTLIAGELQNLAFKNVFWAAYVGVFEMGIAFIFWLLALQNARSTDRVSNLVYLTPFLSLLVIRFILGEELYASSIIGLCLIVSGIVFRQINFTRRQTKSA